ncbi:unnamed protein product [Euphydryas editha]|uniref:Uncharacterized protein n=1 Tax=Euphydryas editha TaxID=104508 RepID=A0AAU9UHK7_EUPED|nr:unnamed protein product [Euphydryas editha]
MKVLALVILAVASAAGKGSGPYLPSGWRPQGPGFYLPSEVKPSKNIQEIILAGSEASGSDSLREYGPPTVLNVQNLINQGLPDAVTEQSFEIVPLVVDIEKKDVIEAIENTEAKTEQAVEQSEATTESANQEDLISNVESTQASIANEEISNANVEISQLEKVSKSAEKSIKSESHSTQESSSSYQSSSSQESSSSLSQSSASQESSSLSQSSLSQVSQESLSSEQPTGECQTDVTERSEEAQVSSDASTEQVQNIPDIISNLENENKAQQTKNAVNDLAVKDAGIVAPDGLLEYGPPGFAEYGPPKV